MNENGFGHGVDAPSVFAPASAATGSPGGAPPGARRTIRVSPFSDHRTRIGSPAPSRLPDSALPSCVAGSDPLIPEADRVTRLFLKALLYAGHDAIHQGVGLRQTADALRAAAVLDGRIWDFRFRFTPALALEVDIELVLTDAATGEILWETDFPSESALPVWVGLGCDAEAARAEAHAEVKAAAALLFRADAFLQAVHGKPGPMPVASPCAGESHAVVAARTWTSTDQGQIHATAFECGAYETRGDQREQVQGETEARDLAEISRARQEQVRSGA